MNEWVDSTMTLENVFLFLVCVCVLFRSGIVAITYTASMCGYSCFYFYILYLKQLTVTI